VGAHRRGARCGEMAARWCQVVDGLSALPRCGGEAVVQIALTATTGAGVRLEAKVVKQCGCGRQAER